MRHRFTKVMLGAALFMLLAGTATVAAKSQQLGFDGLVQDRLHLPAHRRPRGVRRRGDPGLQARAPVRDQGNEQGQRQDARHHLRRRQGRRRHRRHRGEGPDRAGHQDPDGHRLVRRRGADRSARRSEPGAVHLRAGRRRCDHRHQQVHVPRRAADDPGRARREVVPRQGGGQEGRRLRPGQRVRPRQLRGREGVLQRSQRHRDLGAVHRDRLHAVRPAGEERESRPALHRLGRHDGRRDVQDARSAGSLRRARRS